MGQVGNRANFRDGAIPGKKYEVQSLDKKKGKNGQRGEKTVKTRKTKCGRENGEAAGSRP